MGRLRSGAALRSRSVIAPSSATMCLIWSAVSLSGWVDVAASRSCWADAFWVWATGPEGHSTAFGLELTAFDGTTLELPAEDELIAQFGRPTGGPRPLARLVTLVSCGNRRVRAATF